MESDVVIKLSFEILDSDIQSQWQKIRRIALSRGIEISRVGSLD